MRAGIRSLLFVPGDDERKLDRAATSKADALILDLEDAVLPDAKAAARASVAAFVRGYSGEAQVLVRVNGTGSPWLHDDLVALAGLPIAGIMLPKASVASLADVPHDLAPVVALIETARGVEEASAIADDARVARLMLGSADLAADLGIALTPDEGELAYPRARVAMASAAAMLEGPIDVVYLGVSDPDGLAASASRGRALGFTGKACIHPAQVDVVNSAFTPSVDEIDRARRVIGAADAARAAGSTVTSLDGRLIDPPVVLQAERIIALARDLPSREQE